MGITRRAFLKSGAMLAAGAAVMPSWAANSKILNNAANDRINVALIGCGGMGTYNLTDFLNYKNCRCVALSDIDKGRLQETANKVAEVQSPKPVFYEDYRKILDRKDVDAVIIGTPDHWHCLQFTDACAAGKHVYVEKPAGNSIAEVDAMVAAAKRYNTITQVGQQQRSGKLWIDMIDYINTGQLGRIGHVHVWANFDYGALPPPIPDTAVPKEVNFDLWLGPAPDRTFNAQRFHGSWRMFWDYGGGVMTDWGVHLLDMGLWGMGVKTLPLATMATGGNFYHPDGAHETFDTVSVSYKFDKFIMTWENNSGVETGPYGKNYGILFKGTNGTLVANRDDWQVYPEGDKIPAITVYADDQDHNNHVGNFLECLKNGNKQTACNIENGAFCVKYAQLGNIAARTGSILQYDDIRKTFGNKEADQYLKPQYRAPWKFPTD
jgi:predicted dehydrogenase